MESKMLSVLLVTLLFDLGMTLTETERAQFGVNETSGSCASVSVTFSQDGSTYTITGNGMPDHVAGTCGCQCPPKHQNVDVTLPSNLDVSGDRYATFPGTIGFAKNGVAIFNPLNGPGQNAVAGPNTEVFDTCNGHAEPNQNSYHYHKLPICIYDTNNRETEQFMGVALDGFPIYSSWQADLGRHATNADLDECHGRMKPNQGYRYVINGEFPYMIGCFRAEPQSMRRTATTVTTSCQGFSARDLCDAVHGTVTYDGPEDDNWDQQGPSNQCCADVRLRTDDECDQNYNAPIANLTDDCVQAMGPPGGMGGMTCPDGSPRLPRHEVDPDNPGDPPGCPSGRDGDGDGDGSGDDDGAGTAVSTVGVIAAMNVIVQIIVHVHELI